MQAAQSLGYGAIAITDHATLAGIVRAHGAAKQAGIRLIVGCHLEPCDAAPLVVWVRDRTGYANLCRLLTHGYAQAGPQSQGCLLSSADIAAHAEGLLAGVPLAALLHGGGHPAGDAVDAVVQWREVFGDRLAGIAEIALEGDD